MVVSPVALVAAPLAVCLAVPRPSGRDLLWLVVMGWLAAFALVGPADSFAQLERAWLVLLTAGVAVVLALGRPRRYITVALPAVAGAGTAAALLLALTGRSWGQVIWIAERHFGSLMRQLVAVLTQLAGAGATGSGADALSALDSYGMGVVRIVSALFPGLVLLQSLAAIALAWALYHRIAREPQGEPLGTLAAFRFNDHLIWGVAVSLLVLVLPRLGWLNAVGGNLLVFFSGLYVVRGVAVLAAAAAAGLIGGPFAVLAATFLTLFLMPVAALGALALGLTDTLMDWRERLARAIPKP